MTDTIKNA